MKKIPFVNEVTEIRSNRLLLAEGFDRIKTYTEETVSVSGKRLALTVEGKKLTLKCLERDKICVEGYIKRVTYEQCDK